MARKSVDSPKQNAETKVETAVAKPYEPSEREANMLASLAERRRTSRRGPLLRSEMDESGEAPVNRISVDHPDPATAFDLLMEGLAVVEYPMLAGLLSDLGGLAQKGSTVDADRTNYALSIARGINPQDTTESLLATQMAAVHMSTMKFANLVAATSLTKDGIPKLEAFERSMNRLARTFAAQIEALKRYRSKGEQRVIVERVTVNEGGQAIVGAVGVGGREGVKLGA